MLEAGIAGLFCDVYFPQIDSTTTKCAQAQLISFVLGFDGDAQSMKGFLKGLMRS